MSLPAHWPELRRLLGTEEWFRQLEQKLSSGAAPESFFEQQLHSDDYGAQLALWLAWAAPRGGIARVLTVLRSAKHREDIRATGKVYRWRQALDEMQAAYLIDQQTSLRIATTEEPPGRNGKVLDWVATSATGAAVLFEVKSLFNDPNSVYDEDGAIGRIAERTTCFHGPFGDARGKFKEDTPNCLVFLTHQEAPSPKDAFFFLYGPEITRAEFNEDGGVCRLHTVIDGSRRGASERRPPSAYAHFSPHDNSRVGGMVFMHSRPDGGAGSVLFHNPWARPECALRSEWFDPWCQVFAAPADGKIRFSVRGSWPAELLRPPFPPFA